MKEHITDFVDESKMFFESLGNNIPIFEPDRPFRFIYDLLMLFYLTLLIANIFLKFGFDLVETDYTSAIWILFEELPCWLFIMEAVFDLNTAYHSMGNFVSNRMEIFKHYMKYYFLSDILTIFPFFLSQMSEGKYLQVLVVFRMKNVENLLKKLEEYLQLKGKKEGLFQLIKLIINLLFLAHISACAWHYIAFWEIKLGVTNNWLAAKHINNENWYIRSFLNNINSIVNFLSI